MRQLFLTGISVAVIWCLTLLGFAQSFTTPTLAAKNSDLITTAVNNKTDVAMTSPTLPLMTEQEALTFLSKLEEKYKQIEMISGEFKQLKRSTLFLEEINSQGRFYFKKPGKFRCDYLPPNESVNIIVDNTAWIYVPEIKQVEKYYLGKSSSKVVQLNQLLLGFGASVKDIQEVYAIKVVEKDDANNSLVIKFILREPSEELNFEAITIWFNTKELMVKKVLIDEMGDDETIIEITRVELNKPIAESLFRLYFPKDVEIIEHY